MVGPSTTMVGGWYTTLYYNNYNGWGMIHYTIKTITRMVQGWHTTLQYLQWLLSESHTMQGGVRHGRSSMVLPALLIDTFETESRHRNLPLSRTHACEHGKLPPKILILGIFEISTRSVAEDPSFLGRTGYASTLSNAWLALFFLLPRPKA